MFELADRLVGIYKTNDATKSVTINPRLFEQSVGGSLPVSKRELATPSVSHRAVLVDATNKI